MPNSRTVFQTLIVLQENKRLEQSNKELQIQEQKTREEAEASVSAVKASFREKEEELHKHINAARAREEQARQQIEEETSRINSLADYKITSTKDRLERAYKANGKEQRYFYNRKMQQLEVVFRAKTDSLHALTFGSALYGFLVTVLTASKSPRCCYDLKEACRYICIFFSFLWDKASIIATSAWSLNTRIPYDVVNVIVPGLLAGLGFLLIIPGIPLLISFGIFKAVKTYADHFADNTSALVALISLALLVWFADRMTFVTWNLIIVFLFIHLLYLLLRIMFTSDDFYR